MAARYLIGDVFDGIECLDDGSVDLVLTSPPFLALRSYLPVDHLDKAKEIGSEATPAAFIDTLLDVVEAITPKLAEHGSIAIELGDTYSGSGGAGGDYSVGGLRDGQDAYDGAAARSRGKGTLLFRDGQQVNDPARRMRPVKASQDTGGEEFARANKGDGMVAVSGGPGWPLAKSLCLIPESFRWALVYGRNPFNGRETPRWRARNVVRWCRPNPPVGALGDKYRPATSEMVIACKSAKRWFDLDAVRTPLADSPGNRYTRKVSAGDLDGRAHATNGVDRETNKITAEYDPARSNGAPPLDWWEIPTEPYKGSHYATWPRQLLDKPILSMCPRRVCRQCGEPSRRIVGEAEYVPSATYRGGSMLADSERVAEGVNQWVGEGGASASVVRSAPTLGWSECSCADWRPGVVLDPFAGSGTTLQVAIAHGRSAVGIDLDERNAELARERVGLFLSVEHLS